MTLWQELQFLLKKQVADILTKMSKYYIKLSMQGRNKLNMKKRAIRPEKEILAYA